MVYPEVLWAQNATELYVTVNVQDVPHPKITLTDSLLTWEGGNKDKSYSAEMPLFKEVDPKSSKQSVTDRNSFFVIKKAAEGWWPRLTKDKAHYIKTDFTRWKSEDDDEDPAAAGAGGNPFDMDFSQFSNMGGMGGMGGMPGMPGMGGMAGDLPPDEDDDDDMDNEDGKDGEGRVLNAHVKNETQGLNHSSHGANPRALQTSHHSNLQKPVHTRDPFVGRVPFRKGTQGLVRVCIPC
ncbi:hypothetical protein HDU93_006666 [Gonapodya sp. JEL0774]|nr:hypothetical protein HDU93_006666 [Gonapodya sp. JEL0774]